MSWFDFQWYLLHQLHVCDIGMDVLELIFCAQFTYVPPLFSWDIVGIELWRSWDVLHFECLRKGLLFYQGIIERFPDGGWSSLCRCTFIIQCMVYHHDSFGLVTVGDLSWDMVRTIDMVICSQQFSFQLRRFWKEFLIASKMQFWENYKILYLI